MPAYKFLCVKPTPIIWSGGWFCFRKLSGVCFRAGKTSSSLIWNSFYARNSYILRAVGVSYNTKRMANWTVSLLWLIQKTYCTMNSEIAPILSSFVKNAQATDLTLSRSQVTPSAFIPNSAQSLVLSYLPWKDSKKHKALKVSKPSKRRLPNRRDLALLLPLLFCIGFLGSRFIKSHS